MVEQTTLKADQRTKLGTRSTRKLRAGGLVPAIVYGHGETVRPVSVDLHDLTVALQHGVRMFALDVNGTNEQVLVKDVQYDYLGTTIIHADFARVRLDEQVTLAVALDFHGTPKGVEAGGGVLTTPLSEIEVECLPAEIPSAIRVEVMALDVGETLTVADLKLPEGVKAVTDGSSLVATVTVVAEEEEAPAEEAGEAEPEVIGAKEEAETEPGEKKEKKKEG
jgi:large subunit ribosomal protein L25